MDLILMIMKLLMLANPVCMIIIETYVIVDAMLIVLELRNG